MPNDKDASTNHAHTCSPSPRVQDDEHPVQGEPGGLREVERQASRRLAQPGGTRPSAGGKGHGKEPRHQHQGGKVSGGGRRDADLIFVGFFFLEKGPTGTLSFRAELSIWGLRFRAL